MMYVKSAMIVLFAIPLLVATVLFGAASGTAGASKIHIGLSAAPRNNDNKVAAGGVKVLKNRLSFASSAIDEEVAAKPVTVRVGNISYKSSDGDKGLLLVAVNNEDYMPGTDVQVFEPGYPETPVAQAEVGEEIVLPAGIYDVKVGIGRSDARVECLSKGIEIPSDGGKKLSLTLPVGTIKVNSFTRNNERMNESNFITLRKQIEGADTTVYFYEPGNTSDNLFFVNGAETFPVDPGTYDLRVEFTAADDKQSNWIKNVSVVPGKHQLLQGYFSAWELKTDVYVGGDKLPADLFEVYYYPLGETENFVCSKVGSAPAVLSAGSYDIRVGLTKGPYNFKQWMGNTYGRSGQSRTFRADLDAGVLVCNREPGSISLEGESTILCTASLGDKIFLPSGSYTYITSSGEPKSFTVSKGRVTYR